MPTDPSPVVAVRRFAVALREIRRELLRDLSPIADISELLVAVRSGRVPRIAVTAGGIEYTVHGIGCRMIAPDGRQVDVDLIADPVRGRHVEAFDAWRIGIFLDDEHGREEINLACAHLAADGFLREIEPGRWYALGDGLPGSSAV